MTERTARETNQRRADEAREQIARDAALRAEPPLAQRWMDDDASRTEAEEQDAREPNVAAGQAVTASHLVTAHDVPRDLAERLGAMGRAVIHEGAHESAEQAGR